MRGWVVVGVFPVVCACSSVGTGPGIGLNSQQTISTTDELRALETSCRANGGELKLIGTGPKNVGFTYWCLPPKT